MAQYVPVTIQAIGDPPALGNTPGAERMRMATIERLIVLEGGMESGKPSTAIIIRDQNQQLYMVEIGAEMFLTLAAGVKGACARFGFPWEGV